MSSTQAARPHPPSSRRSAEARAQGHLPRAPLAGVLFALLSLLLSLWALAPRVFVLLTRLLREPLELAARGQAVAAEARLAQLLGELTGACALALLAIVVGVGGGLFVVQGPAFASSSRTHGVVFPALSLSRTASALWCVGLLLITALALGQFFACAFEGALRRASFSSATLPALAAAWAGQLGALSVAALLVDVAFARARFFASLWSTRREFQDEQRLALGPAEPRAARERARRAFWAGT
jgi:flagellar biosynthesis protein FlhB